MGSDFHFFTSSLRGGIGNQLFQVSHALAQGWKYDVPVIFPYELDISAPHWENRHYKNNIYRNLDFSYDITGVKTIEEKKWNDPDLSFDPKDNNRFLGYFQSSKNFLGYEDKIRKEFSPTDVFIEEIKKIYPDIESPNTLSLHVRRTDYLRITTTLPTIDKSYYIESIGQNGGYSKLFIFSDDMAWAKKNLMFPNTIFVDLPQTYQELWLMSLCKNNIISNSSFSWWGAWLNNNKDKRVFMPSIWFGPAGPNPHDSIFEPDWIKIKVKYSNGVLYKD